MAVFYSFFMKYDEDKDDDVRSLSFYFMGTRKNYNPQNKFELDIFNI